MHPHVKKLLAIQKVDQEIASLRKDLDTLPAEEAKRKRKLDELERVAAEKKERATKYELDTRALEKAIKGGDEEVKKLTERLNTVRNNAEYQATLFQIEAVKKDRDLTQEECLKLLEQLEGLRAEQVAAAKVAADERKVFEAFLAEAEKLRQSRAGDLAAVAERRKAVADGVPADVLGDYQRLFATRSGLAICAVDKGYCQGCFNKITTNDMARLMGGSAVVSCGSCQRVLFLPEQAAKGA